MALRKIDLMHRQFGKTEGHTCRECNNLVKYYANTKPVSKCKIYGETNSEASDWVQRYQACGMFNKPWDKKPVIRLVVPERKKREEPDREPIEGQLSMGELV